MTNSKGADFTYTESFPWVSLMPHNTQAENVWREFCKTKNTPCFSVLFYHKTSCFAALKKAGYTVKKQKKLSVAEIKKIDAEIAVALGI
jgi:hypothetical protein